MSAKRSPGPKITSSRTTTTTTIGRGGGTVTTTHGTTKYANGRTSTYTKTTRTAPGRAPAKRKPSKARKRSAAGLLYYGDWVTGYNDEAPTCAATAIANSLLTVTGIRVTDDDVLLLYRQSGGGPGISLTDSLAALATHGIAGHFPASCSPLEGEPANGDIVGLAGTHAASYTPDGLISWGTTLADEQVFPDGEAWRIDWAA